MGNNAIMMDNVQPHLSANKAPAREAMLVSMVVIVPAITPLLKRGYDKVVDSVFRAKSSFNFFGHVTDLVPPSFVEIVV